MDTAEKPAGTGDIQSGAPFLDISIKNWRDDPGLWLARRPSEELLEQRVGGRGWQNRRPKATATR